MFQPYAFRIGTVLGQTFRIFGRHGWIYALLATILVGAPEFAGPLLVSSVVERIKIASDAGAISSTQTFIEAFVAGATPGLVALLDGLYLAIVIADTAAREASDTRAPLGPSLGRAVGRLPGAVLVSILIYLGLTVGFLLLVVPCFILSCVWAVVIPAYVVERPGIFGAFDRSRVLTKGCRWRIFGLTLILAVIVGAGAFAAAGLNAFVAEASGSTALVIATGILVAVARGLTSAIGAAGGAAIYVELRRTKEGVMSRDLVEAFA